MIIVESLNRNYKDDIKNIGISLDLQWWLFKSVLCVRALDKSYYIEWYKLYNNFSNLIDDIYTKTDNSYKAMIYDFKNILNNFDRFKSNIKPQLSPKLFDDLCIVIDKLSKGTKDIIEILKDNTEAF